MARLPEGEMSDGRPVPNRRSDSQLSLGRHAPPRPRGWAVLLTRDAWANFARTMSWLAPLTLLIWVYAEREQTVHTGSIGVTTRVTTAMADRFVELASGAKSQTINLRLSGPQNGIDEVRQALGVAGLTIDVGSSRGAGRNQTVGVVAAIQNTDLFRRTGVSVDEAQPPDVVVNVDDVVEREATVVVDPRQQTTFAVATFEPPHVTLRGPRHQLDALTEDGKLVVYADPAKLDEATRGTASGRADGVAVTLPVPEDQVHLLQATVSAKVQVRAADKIAEIRSVPIQISASPDTLRQYDVTLNDNELTLPFVHVVGPPQQVDALVAAGNLKAELSVEPADATRTEPKRLYFVNLPPGVTLAPQDAAPTVGFSMVRRGGPAGG